MKKTNIIRCLKLLALILPILLFIWFAQEYVLYYSNHNTERISRFYQEEENSIDVAFLGASDVFTGYAPAWAYEEYGFTSYMYAMDSNPGVFYKYQLKEVLSKQQPQVIFVEINGFLYEYSEYEEQLRIFTENIPMSMNKLEAVFRFQEEDRLSFLLPFVAYHTDWGLGEITDKILWKISSSQSPSLLKGNVTFTDIDIGIPEIDQYSPEETEATLVEFIQYCQKENLENIVFVRFPHKNAANHALMVQNIEKIVKEHGYTFLNLEEHVEMAGLDSQYDYYNFEHLNIYGQQKLTSYLGDMIVNDFGVVPVTQSEGSRRQWETCVEYYHNFYEYSHTQITNNVEEWLSESRGQFEIFRDWVQKQ